MTDKTIAEQIEEKLPATMTNDRDRRFAIALGEMMYNAHMASHDADEAKKHPNSIFDTILQTSDLKRNVKWAEEQANRRNTLLHGAMDLCDKAGNRGIIMAAQKAVDEIMKETAVGVGR